MSQMLLAQDIVMKVTVVMKETLDPLEPRHPQQRLSLRLLSLHLLAILSERTMSLRQRRMSSQWPVAPMTPQSRGKVIKIGVRRIETQGALHKALKRTLRRAV